MRSLWAAGLLLRRLRTEPGVIALLFVLVAGTAFLFAAAPRLFNQVSDEALRYEVAQAAPAQRNLQLALASNLSARSGGVSGPTNHGLALQHQFPPSLQELVDARDLVVTTARFSLPDPPEFTTYLTLRYQDGLTDATRLVAGRWPRSLGSMLPPATIGLIPPSPETDGEPPMPFEIAISADAAADVGISIGDHLPVLVDGSDPLLARTFYRIVPTEMVVVGTYRAVDPTADYWYGDVSLLQIFRAGSLDAPIAYVTAYFAADDYPGLVSSGLPFRYQWRFNLATDRLDAGQVPALLDDLRRVQSDFLTGSSELSRPGGVVLRTGLLDLVERFQAKSASSEAVLSIAAIGPFALAGGALGMLAILLVTRRRSAIGLARGRGASSYLILGTQLWEASILAGAAALLGLLGAVTLVPARANPLSPILAVAVAAAATLLLVGSAWPAARRPLGQLERDDPPALRVSPRRLVIELTVVAIAVAGALLLRGRGLTAAGGDAHFDPLLAAVPVLSGLAVGIVAMRLYPLPIRGVGWLAARRRDLVPVLGLRTVGRHPAAANLPLLVLMLTAAFAAFSSVIVTSVDRGQVAASWLNVGADYRVEMVGLGALSPQFDPTTVDGVEAVAPGIVDTTAGFASVPNQRASILLDTVDPGAYQLVTAGSPADPAWPAPMLAQPTGPGLGTLDRPIPAILSPRLPIGSANLLVGDTFEVTVRDQPMTFVVAEKRASFPGIGAGVAFVVAPFNWIQEAFENKPLRPSVMWVRGPAGIGERLATLVREGTSARLVSRHQRYAALHDAPLVAAIARGFGAALVVAALYTALTIIGALTLSAARRTQDLAFLRTLGVTSRQALWLTVVEHAPPVILALVPGIALGIGVALLLEPGLGLGVFVGTDAEVTLAVDWGTMALISGALLVVVVLAITAGTWLSRRARLVDALRIGDD
jgi:putative ABC transport system permease protein